MSRSGSGYHHGNLPDALERAAMALLETQPAGEISLREVARAAGVSHNAPYHHFGDRRALLKVLAERSMAALVASQQAAAAGTADARERLRAIARDYVRFAAERPNEFAVVYDPTVCVPGHPTETMAPLIRAEEELVAGAVRGALPQLDPEAAAAMSAALWGAAHGLAQLVQAGHLALEQALAALDSLIDQLVPVR